jgi:hypothetical protein
MGCTGNNIKIDFGCSNLLKRVGFGLTHIHDSSV